MPGHTCLGDGLPLLERLGSYIPPSKGVELKSSVTRAHNKLAQACALVCLCLATPLVKGTTVKGTLTSSSSID
jgi:hypothetical protein